MPEPFKYQRIFLHADGVIPGPTRTTVGDWEAAVDAVVKAARADLCDEWDQAIANGYDHDEMREAEDG